MLDQELSTTGLEVCVGRQGGSTLDEAVVRGSRVGVCGGARVVQRREDTRGTALLDEVAHDLVVEVLDGIPLDLFPNILFLLGLEGELDEDLLQLLVDVVDAQLLERVVL